MSSFAREYLSGSLASSFTYLIFAPIETIKTRMQLQDAPGYTRTYRHGMLPALRTVLTQDGLVLFWSHGLAAGVCRDFCYSGIRTGMYPTVRDAIASGSRGGSAASRAEASLLEKIAAGATTGSVGAGLANAMDVVRVRMVAEGGRVDPASGKLTTGLRAGHAPRYSSSMHCLAATARAEGVLHGLLLRGVGASMSRAGLLTAAQMSTYDHAKTVAKRNGVPESTALHVAAALLSGLVAAAACNPADVLKSRVMAARSSTAARVAAGGGGGAAAAGSSSTLGIAWHTLTHEGVAGFYRGFLPNYARLGPTILIQMPIAEALRRAFGVRAL